MARTWIRQDVQIAESTTFTDNLTVGSTLESGSTSIESDLNALRSQVRRMIWADTSGVHWYDDLQTVNSKKRGQKALNDDLNDLEVKPILFRTQRSILPDISVPAAVAGTGTLTIEDTYNAVDTETVTIGTKTYTFQDTLTNVDGNVKIGATASDTLDNLIAAINLSAGAGTLYATAMTVHPTVSAAAGAGDTIVVTSKKKGTHTNSIGTTEAMSHGSWGSTTLAGGAGDVVVLVAASNETPGEDVADPTSSTVEGTVAAQATTIGTHSLAEIAGANAMRPASLCLVVNDSGAIVDDQGKDIYALLQCESASGGAINDTTNQVQLSFVVANDTYDDLEPADATYIGGKIINYSYVRRIHFDNIPQWAFLSGVFLDQTAISDVSLDNAIDNQAGLVTQTQNIDWNVADSNQLAFTADNGTTDLLNLSPTAGGNTMTINVDTLDINTTVAADFNDGITVDSAGVDLELGITPGQINTTGTDDLTILGARELFFDDGNRTSSDFSVPLKLSDADTEWDTFETNFGGEVSLLNAINQAYTNGGRTKGTAILQSNVSANTDVDKTTTNRLDVDLPSYADVDSFVTDVDVYLNGELLRNGVDLDADHDVYPGSTPSQGMLRFEFALKGGVNKPDQLTMIVYNS